MSEYLSCAETAKLIRAQLKKHFPGQKFSVRSSVYAGGASIDVDWIGGPRGKDVEAIAKQFSGASFDGMIDLKHSHSSWLLPDGSAIIASDPGTTGSMGMHEPVHNDKPHPDARLVRFGSCFVFCHRGRTESECRDLLRRAKRWTNADFDPATVKLWEHRGNYSVSGYIPLPHGDDLGTVMHRLENGTYDDSRFDRPVEAAA